MKAWAITNSRGVIFKYLGQFEVYNNEETARLLCLPGQFVAEVEITSKKEKKDADSK